MKVSSLPLGKEKGSYLLPKSFLNRTQKARKTSSFPVGKLICFWLICFSIQHAYAQTPQLKRQTLSRSADITSSPTPHPQYIIRQSIGQASPIGSTQTKELELRQGFIQPFISRIKVKPSDAGSILVFPNPFHDKIQIQFQEQVNHLIELEVLDVSGRIVHRQSFPESQNIRLSLPDLSMGIYLLNIKCGQKLYGYKIQKR